MMTGYDATGMRAARLRIVSMALAAAKREQDEAEGPRTLRSAEVAAAFAEPRLEDLADVPDEQEVEESSTPELEESAEVEVDGRITRSRAV